MTHPYIYKKRGGIQVAKIAQNEGANAILAAEHTLKKAPQQNYLLSNWLTMWIRSRMRSNLGHKK